MTQVTFTYDCGSNFGHLAYLFTGKERDAESGNDYFTARYYGSSMGRFLSPDEPFADFDPENPQSWNLYSYVLNNPLSFTDPLGLNTQCATQTVTYNGQTIATTPEHCNSKDDDDSVVWYDPFSWFNGLFRPSFHGSLKPRPQSPNNQIDCSKPPPNVPTAPPGVNVDAKVADVFEANYDPTGITTLYAQFRTDGPMDYKQLSPDYLDFGNFLYGAACQAINGIPSFCHGAAGLNRDYRALRRRLPLGSGVPFFSGLMGDQAQDFKMIQAGIEYQQWMHVCKGTVY